MGRENSDPDVVAKKPLYAVFDPGGRMVGVYRYDGAKARLEVILPSLG